MGYEKNRNNTLKDANGKIIKDNREYIVKNPLDIGDIAYIKIKSLAHKEEASFIPYNFTFDDNFKPEWQEYNGFGRMDPIMVYKKTSRDINISFDVISENDSSNHAIHTYINFLNLQLLIKHLYPIYSSPSINTEKLQDIIKKLKQEINEFEKQDNITSTSGYEELALKYEAARNDLSQELQTAETNILSAQQENEQISKFGINIIQKSPLFVISFMNLLNNSQYVCAINNFKYKLIFDEGRTLIDPENAKVIPGKFNISLGFKVMHNYLPGTILNY